MNENLSENTATPRTTETKKENKHTSNQGNHSEAK